MLFLGGNNLLMVSPSLIFSHQYFRSDLSSPKFLLILILVPAVPLVGINLLGVSEQPYCIGLEAPGKVDGHFDVAYELHGRAGQRKLKVRAVS